ncbi:hypothetical protein QFZ40_001082 [Arthrobacter pascens]|uniref:Hpt domain-containing protein n=1 Tax=Arthrobacter pascens TaxID=1677 RepID=UPI002788936B|nr:Hpt domain-containing protein [Arthrobacter pascens]MDQ0633173.1 hypothetical protein [Arthrobacter pascens]
MANSAAHSGDPGTHTSDAAARSAAPGGGALPRGGQELPLVDAVVLQDLEDELGRRQMAWDFAKDYAAMWGLRQRCLLDSIQREDRVAALDAVISLKVSSAMVGGLRLERLAETLESTIRKGDLRDGAALLALISLHGQATVKELQLRYLQPAR